MTITVHAINIPAMSTIGTGYGYDEDGNHVIFAGDHRPLRHLGEHLAFCAEEGLDPPEVDLEDWQILSVRTREEVACAVE